MRRIIKLASTPFDIPKPKKLTLGQKLADKVTDVGSNWYFIIFFGIFIISWMIFNSLYLLWKPFDPFPYILLNLILSCLAAIQAPIIMMSQRRLDERDHELSKYDLEIDIQTIHKLISLEDKLGKLIILLEKKE